MAAGVRTRRSCIRAAIVGLIFIELEWLPWNIVWQVTVVVIPLAIRCGAPPHRCWR
jgi:hypothetical protein